MTQKIDYHSSGVSYDLLDPFKIRAQKAALETNNNLSDLIDNNGKTLFRPIQSSRGESAYLIETDFGYIAHVEETLGTKNLIADAVYALTGKTYYDNIAEDAVAAIVNDLITVGALPISIAMHFAVGNSEWFTDEKRSEDLVKGWKHACDLSSAIWTGGETPTLSGILLNGTCQISGSAVGVIPKKDFAITSEKLCEGDRIILLESSGIHTNGASLARKVAEAIPDGYLSKMPDGSTFGDALLQPTINYTQVIRDCYFENISLHYASHLTGHGWRKLMRATEPFRYIIERVQDVLPVFLFLQEHAHLNDKEMYGTFNMGSGFALYVDPNDSQKVIDICEKCNIRAIDAGVVEKAQNNEKSILIADIGIEFTEESLKIRH